MSGLEQQFAQETFASNPIAPLGPQVDTFEARSGSHQTSMPRCLKNRDPFDRMLVAQGQLEKLPIMTGDSQIAKYAVTVIW